MGCRLGLLDKELGSSLAADIESVLHPVLPFDVDVDPAQPTGLVVEPITLALELRMAMFFLQAGDLALLLNRRAGPSNRSVGNCFALGDSL